MNLSASKQPPLKRMIIFRTMMLMMMMMTFQNVDSKPQDAGAFEKVASEAILAAGNVAEIVQKAGAISKDMAFDLPFARANSETKAGTGTALDNNDNASDDDSFGEDRRKRSIDFQIMENALIADETLMAVAPPHHFHRVKRAPCHTYGGGAGGGGGVPSDADDIEAARRRRMAYARKRLAAAKKAKSKKTSTNSSRKKLFNDNEEGNQVLTRRKRQSEVDDLTQTTQNTGNGFAQQAQRIAEKIQRTFDNFMTSAKDVLQKLQQHFTPQNATTI